MDDVPTGPEIGSPNTITSLEDAQVAIDGLYSLLKYYTVFGNYMIQMGDMRGDLLVACEGNYPTYSYDYDPYKNDPHHPFNTALRWSDDKVMLPISSDERIIYPELKQNPGYRN